MVKAAARQGLVKVEGIEGYWQTKSGGNIAADSSKSYDGGSLKPDVISAPPEADNVTVSRHYDHTRDAATLKALRRQVGSLRTTVSITPTDSDMVALDTPTIYPDALLVGMTEPEVDSSSGDFQNWELEWAIGDFV